MKTFTSIARLLLGLVYVVFGLDYFLHFIAKIVTFPSIGDGANNYFGALAATGYFFPVLKSVEIIAGIFLVVNKFTPLFLIVLIPISLQICLFDIFLAPQLLWLGGSPFLLNIFLLIAYRKYYMQLIVASPVI